MTDVQIIKAFLKACGMIFKWVTPLRKQRKAGREPAQEGTFEVDYIEAGLQRLLSGAGVSGASKGHRERIEGSFVVPEILKTPNVRDWLATAEVQNDLRAGAREMLLGRAVSEEVRLRLVENFTITAMSSVQEAEPVIDASLSIVKSGLRSQVKDPALGGMIETGFSETRDGFSEIKSLIAGSKEAVVGFGFSSMISIDEEMALEWRKKLQNASKPLLSWPRSLEKGEEIERPEIFLLREQIKKVDSQSIALLGQPGSGKSALLASLASELVIDSSVALFCIKADQLSPEVSSEEHLKAEYHLPALPSQMIASLANHFRIVILVDQVDALAGHLDIGTARLSTILNFVNICNELPNVHVIISCREFEFSHDLRLSRLEAQKIELTLPSWDSVKKILNDNGVHAASWSDDIREVLRVPQHLKLFLSLKATGTEGHFSSYTSMLNSVWRTRVVQAKNGATLATLAFEIADAMAERETLSIASVRFEERAQDLNALVSAGILDDAVETIRFTHQTLFEHVLARSFIRNNGKFSAYVLLRKESLFVRPKVWATLTYLRTVEWATYQEEFLALWNTSTLPKHLRFLLTEFIGSVAAPDGFEEGVLRDAWCDEQLLPIILKSIAGSSGWFKLVGVDLVRKAMRDPRWRDLCVNFLELAWPLDAALVTSLLADEWLPNAENDHRTLWTLRTIPKWSVDAKSLALVVASRAQLGHSLNYWLSSVSSLEPEFAVDLLMAFLETLRVEASSAAVAKKAAANKSFSDDGEESVDWYIANNYRQPLQNLIDGPGVWEEVNALAETVPEKLLAGILPWFSAVCQDFNAIADSDHPFWGFPLRYGVSFGDGRSRATTTRESLVDAIFGAIQELKYKDPQLILEAVLKHQSIELAPVQRLIAIAMTMVPKSSAEQAYQFLVDDQRRLHLGSLEDGYITSRELIRACAPNWSAEQTAEIAHLIWSYTPQRPSHLQAPSEIKNWTRHSRRFRLDLLRELPANASMPRPAKESLSNHVPRMDGHSRGIFIEGSRSPLSKEQLSKASVKDVVNAFNCIPDKTDWDHPRRAGQGGNIQLSREFASMAIDHPDHAFDILENLHPDSGQRAAGYAIEELVKSVDPSRIQSTVKRLIERGFNDSQFQLSIAHVVSQLTEQGVAVDGQILAEMEQWLWKGAPPDRAIRTIERTENSLEEQKYLLSEYSELHFVPSDIYPVLSSLCWARLAKGQESQAIQTLHRYWDIDKGPNIWEHLIEIIHALFAVQAEGVQSLIANVLSLEQIDGTHATARLCVQAAVGASEAVEGNLLRWASSDKSYIRRGYGEVVALISACRPEAEFVHPLLNEIIKSQEKSAEREGAAASLAHIVWRESRYQTMATDTLLEIIKWGESAVWHRIFRLFAHIQSLRGMPEAPRLIEGIAARFADAPAPTEPYFIERLLDLMPAQASAIGTIAEKLVEKLAQKLSDQSSSFISVSQEMLDLAITLHRNQGTEALGLRMFEQLVQVDAYQAREVLDELDNRIRRGGPSPRPRLRRKRDRASWRRTKITDLVSE